VELSVEEITAGPRHRRDLGDIDALAASIADVGLLQPVVVTPGKRLIAGARRLQAVKRLGWAAIPVTVAHNLADACAALRAERDENTCRKDFLITEKVALGERLQALEAEAAKRRKREAGVANLPGVSAGKLPELRDAGDTRDKVGKAVGLSGRTYERAKAVVEAARQDPERYAKLREDMDRTGKVAGVYKRLQTLEAAKGIAREPPPLPTGPFRVIVADPPWGYEKRSEDPTHRGACPYPPLTTDEICALPVPGMAHDDCVLWLWATNAFLRDALRVLDAWGFQEKTVLTWVKDRLGVGDWLRGQTEHCLLAVRGKPALTLTNQSTVLDAPRGEHSAKPEAFHQLVESLCPGSKVELFVRIPRPGWVQWGNEVGGAVTDAAAQAG
jgi:N6-adenosine-specific RNA methylase IME4/ParB-like chromosome segregation protein Spo0J